MYLITGGTNLPSYILTLAMRPSAAAAATDDDAAAADECDTAASNAHASKVRGSCKCKPPALGPTHAL